MINLNQTREGKTMCDNNDDSMSSAGFLVLALIIISAIVYFGGA
jgi:hypothetical protein